MVSNCKLFKNIKESDVKKLLTCLCASEVHYNQGDPINLNGSETTLGVVISGKIVVKKIDLNGNVTILDQIESNGVISNLFAFGFADMNFISATAVEPVTVIYFDYGAVFKRCKNACQYHSVFVENLLNFVVEKSKKLSMRIEILSSKTTRDKILAFVSISLANSDSNSFKLPMTLTSLAEYLCVDRSAMMRELKKMSDEGVLKINKGIVTINKNSIFNA